jgi:hypothetical protein
VKRFESFITFFSFTEDLVIIQNEKYRHKGTGKIVVAMHDAESHESVTVKIGDVVTIVAATDLQPVEDQYARFFGKLSLRKFRVRSPCKYQKKPVGVLASR